MLPVEHLSPKIFKIKAVNYCGCQLARRLRWAAPACHEKEGSDPHPAECKFSLQYDWRPDEHFGIRVGTWSLGRRSGKGETFVKN